MRWIAVGIGVVAVLVAAVWSVGLDREAPAGPGEVRVEGGGAVLVEQVVSAARPQHAMPGMGTDDDPVAEGERRVSVDVTLLAPQDAPLEYSVDRFTLEVPGEPARRPHRAVLPGNLLPAGTQLSGTLVFDVPVDVRTGVLAFDGRFGTSVDLPAEEQQSVPDPTDPRTPGPSETTAPGHGAGHETDGTG